MRTSLFVLAACVLATFTFLDPALAAPANKVDICHYPPGNLGNAQDITISENALAAHLDHGDLLGACAVPQVCAVGEVCASPSNLCAIGDCNGPLDPPPPASCPCWYTDGDTMIADSLFGGTAGQGPAIFCQQAFGETMTVVTSTLPAHSELSFFLGSGDICSIAALDNIGLPAQLVELDGLTSEEFASCFTTLEEVTSCGFTLLP